MNGDSIKYTKINQREWDLKKGPGTKLKIFSKKYPVPN